MTPEQLNAILERIGSYGSPQANRDAADLFQEVKALQKLYDEQVNRTCFSGPVDNLIQPDGSVFEELVAEMRAAQKRYAHSRRGKYLSERNGLEEQVDMELARLKSESIP